MTSMVFNLYRYQILPVSNQYSLFFSLDKIIALKNRLFWDVLQEIFQYDLRDKEIKKRVKQLIISDDCILLMFSKETNVNIYNEESIKKNILSYPPAYIFINNDKNIQTIAVQNVPEYNSPKSTLRSIIDRANNRLAKHSLHIEYSPLYKEKSFWDFIEQHKNKIREINFKILTPNMSLISKSLSEDIESIAKSTHAAKTDYKITAAPGTNLEVSRENKIISGLAEYTSQGGGNSMIKAKGTKIYFKSNDHQVKIEIPELEINGNYIDLFNVLRNLIAKEVQNGSNR